MKSRWLTLLVSIGVLAANSGVWASPPSNTATSAEAQSTTGALPNNSKTTSAPDDPPAPPLVTIRGLVRDIACAIENPKAEARTFNLKCATECALAGSPLIVQTDNGTLYIPISTNIPDTDQRPRLMPFVGKFVQVRGRVYERRGTRAIALEDIKELPNVHLTTDAH